MSAPIRQKVEVGFSKSGLARFISHHDLMRLWQRAARRARLPLRHTAGYNPRPRIVFPDAIELGMESECEVAEVELVDWLRPADIERRLADSMPGGIRVRHVRLLPPTRKAQQPVEAEFRAELDVGEEDLAGFGARADDELKRFVVAMERVEGGVLVKLRRIGGKGAKVRDVLSVLTGRSSEELRSVRIRKVAMRLGAPGRKR